MSVKGKELRINQIITENDRETVCLRLLFTGLIVPLRLWILSIAYH